MTMKDVDDLCVNTIRMLSAEPYKRPTPNMRAYAYGGCCHRKGTPSDRMGSFSDCLTEKASGLTVVGRYKSCQYQWIQHLFWPATSAEQKRT